MIEGFGEFPFAIESILTVLKLLYVFGLAMYIIFALVVIRQVAMMSKTVNGVLAPVLNLIAWIHLGAAVFVMLVAITVL